MNEPMPVSSGAELQPAKRKGQFVTIVFSLLVLAVWIWVLNWLFVRYEATNYVKWFLKNGSLISVATSFFALVWGRLGQGEDLLSWHPLRFLASCLSTAGVFFQALTVNLGGPLDGVNRRADNSASIAEALWDSVFAIIMDLLMMLVVLGWLLVVAPGFYVLTLFTGAPGRREIRGTGRRVVVKKEGVLTTITDQPSFMPVPSGAIDVSFGTQPFVLTNALNAVVILVVNMLMTRTG